MLLHGKSHPRDLIGIPVRIGSARAIINLRRWKEREIPTEKTSTRRIAGKAGGQGRRRRRQAWKAGEAASRRWQAMQVG